MISCPYCDTPNRKGSKYCSNCGRRLDTAGAVPCPACNRINPANSFYCAFCGAALMRSGEGHEVGAPTPSAQPSVESPAATFEPVPPSRPGLPQWLYQEPAADAEKPASVPSAVSDALRADREECKYLRGIPGVLPAHDGWLASAVSSYLAERIKT
jgi:hypothetical protein